MSEPEGPPGSPFLGRHRALPASPYRRVVGAHRAPGAGGPSRGYLLTVALLAGTASMPILAAISTGSATVGNSALPDTSTPFLPTPSVGPVVIPPPQATQPAVPSTPTPAVDVTSVPPARPVLPAAPSLPDDSDLGRPPPVPAGGRAAATVHAGPAHPGPPAAPVAGALTVAVALAVRPGYADARAEPQPRAVRHVRRADALGRFVRPVRPIGYVRSR